MNRIRQRAAVATGSKANNEDDEDDDDYYCDSSSENNSSSTIYEDEDSVTYNVGLHPHHRRQRRLRICWCLQLLGALSILCGMTTYLAMQVLKRPEDYYYDDSVGTGTSQVLGGGDNSNLQCPSPDSVSVAVKELLEDYDDDYEISDYTNNNNTKRWSGNRNNKNQTQTTYSQIKEARLPWKRARFLPYLQQPPQSTKNNCSSSGSRSMYISGTGNGWNAYLTLDILLEGNDNNNGQLDIHLTGNDPNADNVVKATKLFSKEEQHGGGAVVVETTTATTFCYADSTNLSHIPSNTFDLVYSGDVQPLLDPLDLGKEIEQQDNDVREGRYQELCHAVKNAADADGADHADHTSSSSTSWMALELYRTLQQRQMDWLGQWVAEMTRIAKPGAPIIVENLLWQQQQQAGDDYCDTNNTSWGRALVVDRQFWTLHATRNTYHWNVDVASVVWETDPIASSRYNVFLQKKKHDGDG